MLHGVSQSVSQLSPGTYVGGCVSVQIKEGQASCICRTPGVWWDSVTCSIKASRFYLSRSRSAFISLGTLNTTLLFK